MDNQLDGISRKIYNYLNDKYPNLNIHNITQKNIKKIISKIIDNSSKNINLKKKDDIKLILGLIEGNLAKRFINDNDKGLNTQPYTNDVNIQIPYETVTEGKMTSEPLNDPRKNIIKKSNEISKDELKDINQQYNLTSESFPLKEREQSMKMMMPETIDKEFTIVIDSKDRDTTLDTKPNEYAIHFSPSEEKSAGYISIGFLNVKSIELVSCVIKDTSIYSTASNFNTNYPYLLLEIDELGSMFEGTNIELNKSFAMLENYTLLNGYYYYDIIHSNANKPLVKHFNPNKSISKMTIKFKTPDGTTFNFGDESDSLITTVNKLTFKIIVSQKNLATQFMDRSTF